jgi:hypothetical protein
MLLKVISNGNHALDPDPVKEALMNEVKESYQTQPLTK